LCGPRVRGGKASSTPPAEPAPLLFLDVLGDFRSRFGEIANVPVARLDPIPVAEKASQSLRLGWRFDDDQRFSHLRNCLAFSATLARSRRAHETAAARAADGALEFEFAKSGDQSDGGNAGERRQRLEIVGLPGLH